MPRRPLATFGVVALVAGAGGAGLVLAGDGGEDSSARAQPPVGAPAGARARSTPGEQRPAGPVRGPGPARLAEVGHAPLGAQLVRRTQLRERPSGRVIRAVGRKTGFGSDRVMAVVARRGSWLGVLTEFRGGSRAAWIPASSATLLRVPYAMTADLSRRELVVRRHGRVVRRVAVAVGNPGTATPTGRYAVTDGLRVSGGGAGSPYGCCALALTGRQPNVPQGWAGGDRLAIHGTSNEGSIGTAASAGCLRASERHMRWLIKRIPAGAILRIRR